MTGASFGTDRLSVVLGQLAAHLVSATDGLNVPDRLAPYLQNDYPDAWHESLNVLTEMGDDPDSGSHLAFAIIPERVPVLGYIARNGHPLESHAEVGIVFAYRLGTGEDGPDNLRRSAQAALDVLRVACDSPTWAPDAHDIVIEPIERFEPVRTPITSWVTVRVRFTIQCISEVL